MVSWNLWFVVHLVSLASAQDRQVINIPEDGNVFGAVRAGAFQQFNFNTSLGDQRMQNSLTALEDGVINVNGGVFSSPFFVDDGGRIFLDDFGQLTALENQVAEEGEFVMEFGMLGGIQNLGTVTIFDGIIQGSIDLNPGSFLDVAGGDFVEGSAGNVGIVSGGNIVINIRGSNVVPKLDIDFGTATDLVIFRGSDFRIDGLPVQPAQLMPEQGVSLVLPRSRSGEFPVLSGTLSDGTEFTFNLFLDANDPRVAILEEERETFAAWIARFPAVGEADGFADDPDGDGLPNGLENVFGTDPSNANSSAALGPLSLPSSGGGVFSFSVNLSPASDVEIAFEWSHDLMEWHPEDVSHEGVSVGFSRSQGEVGPSGRVVEVNVEVNGVARRIFVRARAGLRVP